MPRSRGYLIFQIGISSLAPCSLKRLSVPLPENPNPGAPMNRVLIFAFALLVSSASAPRIQAQQGTRAADLIPRDVLFGNPERAAPQISPNGKLLAWLAPDQGVLNV